MREKTTAKMNGQQGQCPIQNGEQSQSQNGLTENESQNGMAAYESESMAVMDDKTGKKCYVIGVIKYTSEEPWIRPPVWET